MCPLTLGLDEADPGPLEVVELESVERTLPGLHAKVARSTVRPSEFKTVVRIVDVGDPLADVSGARGEVRPARGGAHQDRR